MSRPDEGRPVTDRRVPEAGAVGGAAEPDVLLCLHRGCSRRVAVVGRDVGHPPVAPAVDGTDHRLRRPVVTDEAAGGLDPARQRRLTDEPIAPDGVEELGLGNDPLAVLDQIAEHVEDLRLHCDGRAGALEQVPIGVEQDVAEQVTRHPSC